MFGNTDNTLVHDNYAYNAATFDEVGRGSARNVVVADNLIVQGGVLETIHLTGRFAAVVDNFQFINNTVYDVSDAGATSLFYMDAQTSRPGNFTVRNNIFSVKNYSQVMDGGGVFTHERNITDLMNPEFNFNVRLGPGERMGDPLFVNAENGDFRLKANSPAIGAGTVVKLVTNITPSTSRQCIHNDHPGCYDP